MPWTAEQKREKRRQDAIAKGKTPRIKLQRGKSVELKLENIVSSDPEKTMQEDLETARMHNEDLRQRLMDIGARVDAALLANVRRRMLPGTKVRIKKKMGSTTRHITRHTAECHDFAQTIRALLGCRMRDGTPPGNNVLVLSSRMCI